MAVEITPEAAEAIARGRAAHAVALADHLPAPLAGTVLGYLAHPPYLQVGGVNLPSGFDTCTGNPMLVLPNGQLVLDADGNLAIWNMNDRLLFYKGTESDYMNMGQLDDGRVLTWCERSFHVWDFGPVPNGAAARLTAAVLCTEGAITLVWGARGVIGSPDPEDVYMNTGLDNNILMFTEKILLAATILNNILVIAHIGEDDVFILADVDVRGIVHLWRMPHVDGILYNKSSLLECNFLAASHVDDGRVICVRNIHRSVILKAGLCYCIPESIALVPLVEPPGYVLVHSGWRLTYPPSVRPLATLTDPTSALPSLGDEYKSKIWVLADGTILSVNLARTKLANRTAPAVLPGVRTAPPKRPELFDYDDNSFAVWSSDLNCIWTYIVDTDDMIEVVTEVGPGCIAVRLDQGEIRLFRQKN